ncbi:hypothetical protein KQI84_11590 [bacterium]|nr:hypothetical protein [bacterium]
MRKLLVSLALAALATTAMPHSALAQQPVAPEPLPPASNPGAPGATPTPVGPRVLPLGDSKDILSVPAGSNIPGAQEFTEPVICAKVARSVRALNPTLTLGEPLVLQFRTVGMDPRSTVDFVAAMAFGNDVQVRVTPIEPSGYPFMFTPQRRPEAVPNSVFNLREGEEAELTLLMAHDYNSLSGAAFDTPGKYRLDISLVCKASNTQEGQTTEALGSLEVMVQEPRTEDDQIAWGLVSGHTGVFESLQAMSATRPRDQKILLSVVEQAPNSVLRPYALLSVATGKFLEGRKNPEELEEAIKLLREFLDDYPHHFLADPAQTRMMLCYFERKDNEAARKLFVDMWTDPVHSIRMRPTDPLRRAFLGEPPEDNTEQWMLFADPHAALEPEPTPFEPVDNSEELPAPFLTDPNL